METTQTPKSGAKQAARAGLGPSPAKRGGTARSAAEPKQTSPPRQPGTSTSASNSRGHFEFNSQTAREVFVAGSFNDWRPHPMQRISKSTWAADVPLTPGRYEYRFVVDGQWQEDPNCPEQTVNPFGGRNSVLQLSP